MRTFLARESRNCSFQASSHVQGIAWKGVKIVLRHQIEYNPGQMVSTKYLYLLVCLCAGNTFFHWELVLYSESSPTGPRNGPTSPAWCSRENTNFTGRHNEVGTLTLARVNWVSPFKTEFVAISQGTRFLAEPLSLSLGSSPRPLLTSFYCYLPVLSPINPTKLWNL